MHRKSRLLWKKSVQSTWSKELTKRRYADYMRKNAKRGDS